MSIRIQVITVVLNDAEGLRRTIESVKTQTYADIGHIIIDGGSEDNTTSVIREYGKSISYWVSDNDKGIYDAMNKGILASSATDYICFMNAGDIFFSNTTVENVVLMLDKNTADVLYGDAEVHYSFGFKRVSLSVGLHNLWKGMCFSHQSMFVKSDVMKNNLYNITNSIGADYEFICNIYFSKHRFEYAENIIAIIAAGGLSDIKRVQGIKSHWNVAHVFWPGCLTNFYYIFKIIDAMCRSIIHRFFPSRLRSFFIKLKYRCNGE